MDRSLLNEMIEQKYIVSQRHPNAGLSIYNYSAKAQYDRVWNDATLSCRGLILNDEGDIVARPFPKFFNLGEYENQRVPNLSFDVYEKMDGSLGISYEVDGVVKIATRGSFTSKQSVKATEMLYSTYKESIPKMSSQVTYLFEIIYPENRIVVDYGSECKLVLLAMVDRKTGEDLPLIDIGIPIVKKYNGIDDVNQLKSLEEGNKEGFVIKFTDGYRLKVKFAEYVRLHRIITNVSSISIWEYLKTGQPMEEILDQVPDEFYNWIKRKKTELHAQYTEIEEKALSQMRGFEVRKEAAAYIMTCEYPKIMFEMMDNRDYSQSIWKLVRPVHERPFSEEIYF